MVHEQKRYSNSMISTNQETGLYFQPTVESVYPYFSSILEFLLGIDTSMKDASAIDMKSHMLAKLETNLQQVLSPGTFEKMKRALKDPSLAKKLVIEDQCSFRRSKQAALYKKHIIKIWHREILQEKKNRKKNFQMNLFSSSNLIS